MSELRTKLFVYNLITRNGVKQIFGGFLMTEANMLIARDGETCARACALDDKSDKIKSKIQHLHTDRFILHKMFECFFFWRQIRFGKTFVECNLIDEFHFRMDILI